VAEAIAPVVDACQASEVDVIQGHEQACNIIIQPTYPDSVSDLKFISDMCIRVNKVSVNRCVNRPVEASVLKTSGNRIVRSSRLVKEVVKKPEWMLKKSVFKFCS
jgi:hypothetical protein